MSYDFEAIGGVLLGIPENTAPGLRAAVENSLLLAWLAVRKNPEVVPETTLGKIGWVVSAGTSRDQDIALAEAGVAIIGEAPDVSLRAALSARLAADDVADPVLAAWWTNGTAGPCRALAGITRDGGLWLNRFTMAVPDQRVLVFGRAPSVRVAQTSISGTLNTGAFDAVAAAVAEKIAPYRDQITRG